MKRNIWMLYFKELKLIRNDEKGYLISTLNNEASIFLDNKTLMLSHQKIPMQQDSLQEKEVVAHYLIHNYDRLLQTIKDQPIKPGDQKHG